jgi:CHAT domain-containing protein
LAVGDPLVGGQQEKLTFRRLPEADYEANDIARLFSRHVLLTGKQATLSRVANLLPKAEVFHFAGHAISRSQESGLLLAPGDGDPKQFVILGQIHLRSKDLKKLQLVVLSGCDTAVADQGMIDPGSLVRIFLRSGVPHVVASKWSVDSSVSMEMMAHFYRLMLGGDSASAALEQSEKTIRSDPRTSHPYYWAAFSDFGG